MSFHKPTFDLPPVGIIKGSCSGARLPANAYTYRSYHKMVSRCHNDRNDKFETYGKIGVKVCDRWRKSFLDFIADVGPRPKGMAIDRFPDPNGNYEPGNVRWATVSQNNRNRRTSPHHLWEGKSVSQADLAERYGLRQDIIKGRLKLGWDLERALTTPVGPHGGDVKLPYEQRAHVKAQSRQRKAA